MRNEAVELPGLFDAIDQLERDPGDIVRTCLLLDGCTDDSGVLADAWRARSNGRVRIAHAAFATANAGRARHHAMMLGLDSLVDSDGLLLTTDADSRPAATWLAAMKQALHAAELVTGRIVRCGTRPNPLQDRVEAYYDALFALRRRLDPVPWEAVLTHHCTGGANMGFRAAAYRALGGFAPVPSGEDAQLVDDAARAGLRVRRDAASLVHTSDRRDGRVAGGLAMALRHCDAADADAIRVAHPMDAAWQYRLHAIARQAYPDRLDLIAAETGLSHDHVLGVARDCPNAEAFAMRIVPTPPDGMRSIALPVAEAELAGLVDAREAA